MGPFLEVRKRPATGAANATHLMLQTHPQAEARARTLARMADQLVQSRPGNRLQVGKEAFEQRKARN